MCKKYNFIQITEMYEYIFPYSISGLHTFFEACRKLFSRITSKTKYSAYQNAINDLYDSILSKIQQRNISNTDERPTNR